MNASLKHVLNRGYFNVLYDISASSLSNFVDDLGSKQ